MSQREEIKLFEATMVRTFWEDNEEKWYFCINDVVGILTESVDPADYFKTLRKRDSELDEFVRGSNCPPHQFISTDGKKHAAKCADLLTIFRIIQSIPSKKAEPFKQWMAAVAAERIHQMQDPERGIQMSLEDYKRQGRPDAWINQRMKSIEIRNGLTDQWDARGVTKDTGYAELTNIIYKAWAGLTAKEYKHLKGLHQENLRDNMTNEELVMTMLAELTTTNIEKNENPTTMAEHADAARRGGGVAKVAKEAFEKQTGKQIVTSMNAKQYIDATEPHLELDGDSFGQPKNNEKYKNTKQI